MVNAVTLERYIGYLGNNPSKIEPAEKKSDTVQQIQVVTVPVQQPMPPTEEVAMKKKKPETPPAAKPKCADTKDPFECRLNKRQISLLVDCVNDVKMFNNPVTVEELTAIFRGSKQPLATADCFFRRKRMISSISPTCHRHGATSRTAAMTENMKPSETI